MTQAECLACELITGARPLPGGRIAATHHWVVEHCIGPLGVGTLIVKPLRHVLHVSDLHADEASELGPLLTRAAGCAKQLCEAEQVYVCLWSHADWTPVHIHFVVQPVPPGHRERFENPGPSLQAAMFQSGDPPAADQVATFCDLAREFFAPG